MIIDYCENNITGFTACKQCHKVLGFDRHEIGIVFAETLKNCSGTAAAGITQEDDSHSLCVSSRPTG